MKATVRVIFDRRKTATNVETGSVEIEITSNGKRKRLSTGVNVTKKQWNNGRVFNHPQAIALNKTIEQKYSEICRLTNDDDFQIEKLTTSRRNASTDFLDWMENAIKGRTDIRENTVRQHMVTLHNLQRWGKIRTFKDLTRQNVMLFDEHLKSILNKQSSIHGCHKALKVYINRAIIAGLLEKSPYEGMKISKGKTDSIKFISESERTAIEALPLTGTIGFVRDMFIFSCYTGLAYADMCKVSREDVYSEDGKLYLDDKRQKTGSRYKIRLISKAREILERYDYNLNRITNQKANVFLKAIASMGRNKRESHDAHGSPHICYMGFVKRCAHRGCEQDARPLRHSDDTNLRKGATALRLKKASSCLMGCNADKTIAGIHESGYLLSYISPISDLIFYARYNSIFSNNIYR